MKMRSGVAGCLVVMIALLGTVAGGVAASVVTHTEYSTEWTYLTEVTGLFDGESEIPTFTTYSSSYNWTGWSTSAYDGGTYTGGYPEADADAPYSTIEAAIGESYATSDGYTYIYVACGAAVSLTAGTVYGYDEDGNAVTGDAWTATELSDEFVGLSIVTEDDATTEYPEGSVVGTLTKTGYVYITVTDGDGEYIIALAVVTAVTTETAGIAFSDSTSVNSYPILTSQNYETVDGIDLSAVESSIEFESSVIDLWLLGTYYQYVYGIVVNPLSSDTSVTASSSEMEYLCFLPTVVTLADVISTYYDDLVGTYTSIRLSTTGDYDGVVIARGWTGNADTSDWIKTTYKASGLELVPYSLSWYSDGSGTVGYVDVNLSTNVAVAYSLTGEYLWTTDADNVWLAWGGESVSGWDDTVGIDNGIERVYFGSDLTTVGYWSPSTTYMVISDGIAIDADVGTFVTWANGQRNGSASILFRVDDTSYSYNRIIIPLYDLSGLAISTSVQYALEVVVSCVDGTSTISLSYGTWNGSTFAAVSGMTTAQSLGSWTAFLLTINSADGVYTVAPVTSMTSFTDYSVSDASYVLSLDVSGCTFTRMLWEGSIQSLRFGVVSTDVWLNTYDVVLIDPVLDIMEYFPDLETIRLNIYSFALYGDSITINDQTFEVSGSTISIATASGTATETLANIYISYEGGHTYLTFVNSGVVYDLGITVSTEVSFEGAWYFTSAAWSGESVETEVTEWNPSGFAFDWTECAVIMCGLLVVGAAVVWRVNKGMSWVDGAIVAGAAAVVWVLTGISLW